MNQALIADSKLIDLYKTDESLIFGLKELVRSERRITRQILEQLAEVERRMLYAKMGFGSLFDFCTKELGYSESAAQRRISTMRLMRQVPEIKTKLENNDVNLSTIAQLKSFINRVEKIEKHKMTTEKKSELVELISQKSQKDCEKELIKLAPLVFKNVETEKRVTTDLVEVKFYINEKTQLKVQRAKELLSHVDFKINYADLFDRLLEEFLRKKDPLYKAEPYRKHGVQVLI